MSSCTCSTLRLNLVLPHGIPPEFRGGVHLFIPPTVTGSVLTLYRVTQLLRSDVAHCRESASTVPVVLKVIRATGALPFQVSSCTIFLCTFLFPHLLLVCRGHTFVWTNCQSCCSWSAESRIITALLLFSQSNLCAFPAETRNFDYLYLSIQSALFEAGKFPLLID